mgnify:CR=1 FL=1
MGHNVLPMLITISRQYGAGGSEVARLVAASLGWAVLDNEIVERVAQRAGLAPDIVAREDEAAPTFVERLARALVIEPGNRRALRTAETLKRP